MALTFKGGIKQKGFSLGRGPIDFEIFGFTVKAPVAFDIKKAAGVSLCVAKGDKIHAGMPLASAEGGEISPIYSSVSGTVSEIAETDDCYTVTVSGGSGESGGGDIFAAAERTVEYTPYQKELSKATAEELCDFIFENGLAMERDGMTLCQRIKKLSGLDNFVINCAATEPYADMSMRIVLSNPRAVLGGAKILMKATGISNAVLAITDNLYDMVKPLMGDSLISVVELAAKYPQENEKCLVYALSGRECRLGDNISQTGCAVFTADECAEVYKLFTTGRPMLERVVTVGGNGIEQGLNVSVPVGAKIKDLVAFCHGNFADRRVLLGGPISGKIADENTKISQTDSVVTVMERFLSAPGECINCGRCASVCPAHIMPMKIAAAQMAGDAYGAEFLSAECCFDCGACSYICPAAIDVGELVSAAVSDIAKKRAERLEVTEEAIEEAIEETVEKIAEAEETEEKEPEADSQPEEEEKNEPKKPKAQSGKKGRKKKGGKKK